MRSGGGTAVCRRKPRPSVPSRNWSRVADRGFAAGALGDLRRGLWSVDFLDGVAALDLGYMAEVPEYADFAIRQVVASRGDLPGPVV